MNDGANRLLLHETARVDGSLETISILVRDESIVLVDDRGEHALPDGALDAVMRRYGKPLEREMPQALAEIALPGGAKLSRFRHRTVFDVIGRDYICYETPEKEPLCELATAVTAALSHLAIALRSSAAQET